MPERYRCRRSIIGLKFVDMPAKLINIEDDRGIGNLWNYVNPNTILKHPAPLNEIPVIGQAFQKLFRSSGEISGKDRIVFGDRNRASLLDGSPPQRHMGHRITQIAGSINAIGGDHSIPDKFFPI